MGNVSKELLREYIKKQNSTSTNNILSALKEMFRDVLQESLEVLNIKGLNWISSLVKLSELPSFASLT